MGKSNSTPPAPDPAATANAQAGYDKQTANYNAQLNRYNTFTPLGSQTWTQGSAPVSTFNQGRYDAAVKAAQEKAVAATGVPGGGGGYWSPLDGQAQERGDSPQWIPSATGSAAVNPVLPDRNDTQFFDQSPSTDWTQNITLNPTSQSTLDQSQRNGLNLAQTQGQMLGNARAGMASAINTSNIPGVQTGVNFNGPGFASGVSGGPGYSGGVADNGPGYSMGVGDRGPGYAGPVAQGNLTGLANKATQAAYDSSMSLLSPQMDIDRNRAVTDLANRGIPVGSEGYTNQMGSLDRQQQWSRQQAANNAVMTGMNYDNQLFNQGAQNANLQNTSQQGMFSQGLANAGLQNTAQQGYFAQGATNAGLQNTQQQGVFSQGLANAGLQNESQTQGFNQALTAGNFGNSAQAQMMQQMLGLRNQPLNEYNAMMSGTQVQTPQFQSTPAITSNAPNYQQAVQNQYQGQLNNYNADTASSNSMTSGLMSVAAAAAMAF